MISFGQIKPYATYKTKIPEQLKSAEAYLNYLGVKTQERAYLEKTAFYRYTLVCIPKRSGGKRKLLVPERRLKFLQRRTLLLLEQVYSSRSPVHGFVKGRGAISNANEHQKKPYLLNLDLKDYFGSINRHRVVRLLRSLEIEVEVANAIAAICVTRDQLPQGAPTSPILANMVSFRLDKWLMQFAKKHHLRYTRYADDISFSGFARPNALFETEVPPSGRVAIDNLSNELRRYIAGNGFEINPEKVWFSGPKARKEVTGLIVNEFTNIRRTFVRDVRAALFQVETMGADVAEAKYHARYSNSGNLECVLRGKLEWIAQVRGRSFSAYRSLAKRFNKQFPSALLAMEPTYEEIIERAVWIIEFAEGSIFTQGTAFFLQGIGLVTADHVIRVVPVGSSLDLYRPLAAQKRYKVTASACQDEHRDLVVLSHNVPSDQYLSLSPATTPMRTRDPIIALGYPDYGPGDDLSEREGTILALPTKSGVKHIEVSAILPSGISGGPIVNERYQVCGIAKRGGKDEDRQMAIALSALQELFAQTPPS